MPRGRRGRRIWMDGWTPPRLYLITDRKVVPAGSSLPEAISRALAAAAPFRLQNGRLPVAISLREKDLPTGALVTLALKVADITKTFGADLFINGRVDVALACGAEGVHLPAGELFPDEVHFFSPNLRIGVSTHSASEVAVAAENGADFVVFGPVFDTPSKKGVRQTVGLGALERAARETIPVLALGGVSSVNASACKEAGAWGVACIRAVFTQLDPTDETVSFLAHF